MTPEEEDGVNVLHQAFARWAAMDDVAIMINRVDVYQIIMALQLSSRHPGLTESMREHWVEIGLQLTEHISDNPEIYALTIAGWDQAADVRATEEQPEQPAGATVTCPDDCSGCDRCTLPAAKELEKTHTPPPRRPDPLHTARGHGFPINPPYIPGKKEGPREP